MHFLIFLLFSFTLNAQETFESQLAARKAAMEEELRQWRITNRYSKLPNDKYLEFYTSAQERLLADEIKLHEKYCSESQSNCLTDAQKNQLSAQSRIAVGALTVANRWAHEGKTPEEQTEARQNFENCAKEQKDCDKLPEADRRVATETNSSTNTNTNTNTTPDTNTDTTPETNTDTVTVTVQDDFNQAKTKLEEDLLAMREEFTSKYPNANEEMNAEALNALKQMEATKLQKTLAMFDDLCKKHPGNVEVCLTEDEKKELEDQSSGNNCYYDRRHQYLNASDKDKRTAPESGKHSEEWSALPEPRNCQTLLDKDKIVVETPDTPETPETPETDSSVNEDENSPRNYRAETCKWVSDLPRKIVNGPGCSSRNRSRICTGYVICEQKEGGGKFIRMSTCRSHYCGGSDEDAVRCTKDMAYFSERPPQENKLFVTPRLKNLLKGASEQ